MADLQAKRNSRHPYDRATPAEARARPPLRQGSHYVSLRLGERCREIGIHRSMASKGNCFDNADDESFLATLEKDLLRRRSFATRQEVRIAVFDYIEAFFYTRSGSIRPSTTCHPVQYEKIEETETENAASSNRGH